MPLEPCQISKIEFSAKIVNCWKLLTIYTKNSILDAWKGSENASKHYQNSTPSQSFWKNGLLINKCTAWKLSVIGVVLVRILSDSDWIRTRKTPNTDTFHAVMLCWSGVFFLAICFCFRCLFNQLIQPVLRHKFNQGRNKHKNFFLLWPMKVCHSLYIALYCFIYCYIFPLFIYLFICLFVLFIYLFIYLLVYLFAYWHVSKKERWGIVCDKLYLYSSMGWL